MKKFNKKPADSYIPQYKEVTVYIRGIKCQLSTDRPAINGVTTRRVYLPSGRFLSELGALKFFELPWEAIDPLYPVYSDDELDRYYGVENRQEVFLRS